MHRTTSMASRSRRRLVFLTLLAALLLLALAQAIPAFAAKTPFDGGPIVADTSTYAANDHTVYAMRFVAASGGLNQLDPNTTYYVKVRFTPNSDGSPASTDNRGFVWNSTTASWVQEAAGAWTDFPSVTTDNDGAITQSLWIYYKFGDTTKAGQYYLIASLSTGVSGTTKNGTSFVPVTVFDPATEGGWVHDGVDNSSFTNKRTDIVDQATPGDPLALRFTEKNLGDDDSNGVVDDEQYGPVQNGGFDMAVPKDQALDIRMQKSTWAKVPGGFTLTVPDTDMALGADDTTAPSAPGTLSGQATVSGVGLSWGAATDDTGVTGYDVYRWTDAGAGSGYTEPPVRIAKGATGTTYTDTDVSAGAQYSYLVRAVDAATNVGPRSNTADVTTPKADVTLTINRSTAIVNWGGRALLRGVLDSSLPIAVKTVTVQQSYDGTTWTDAGTFDASSPDGFSVKPTRKTWYRLYFPDDGTHLEAYSSPSQTVTPRVKLGRPVAPKAVKKGSKFTAYGSLVPRHASGTKVVRIKCYQKVSGHWRLRQTVKTVARGYKSYSRYSAKFSLTRRGSWKLVAAYSATAKYAAKTSSAKYVRVR